MAAPVQALCLTGARKTDSDRGALAASALDVDRPAVVFGEALDDSQANTVPIGMRWIGAEERLKGLADGVRCHADAAVLDKDMAVRDLNADPAGIRVSEGIAQQVADDGRDGLSRGLDNETSGDIGLECDRLVSCDKPQSIDLLGDDVVDTDGLCR